MALLSAPHPRLTVCAGALALAAAAGCSAAPTKAAPGGTSTTATSVASAPLPTGGSSYDRIPAIVRQVEPSVVTIKTSTGLGSGIVYRSDGTIVTDAHVVAGARQVSVAFADGKQSSATVIASDMVTDIAVIKVDRSPLPAATFASALPPVGDLAVVIGSPLGLDNTVTAGIISALHRNVPGSSMAGQQPLVDLVQTDAPISPGNSGGAVVDGAGQVVGMSEAYLPPSTGAVALGFATPAPTVVDIADQLLSSGRAQHAYLGLVPTQLTPQIASQLGVSRTDGVVVQDVQPGGPAAAAGLQPGDIITGVATTITPTVEALFGALRQAKPRDRLVLHVDRGGAPRDVTVTVADRPAQ